MSEQRTEQTIKVLQITDVHADRSSQDEMKDGKSSYRPILNNGTE